MFLDACIRDQSCQILLGQRSFKFPLAADPATTCSNVVSCQCVFQVKKRFVCVFRGSRLCFLCRSSATQSTPSALLVHVGLHIVPPCALVLFLSVPHDVNQRMGRMPVRAQVPGIVLCVCAGTVAYTVMFSTKNDISCATNNKKPKRLSRVGGVRGKGVR